MACKKEPYLRHYIVCLNDELLVSLLKTVRAKIFWFSTITITLSLWMTVWKLSPDSPLCFFRPDRPCQNNINMSPSSPHPWQSHLTCYNFLYRKWSNVAVNTELQCWLEHTTTVLIHTKNNRAKKGLHAVQRNSDFVTAHLKSSQ